MKYVKEAMFSGVILSLTVYVLSIFQYSSDISRSVQVLLHLGAMAGIGLSFITCINSQKTEGPFEYMSKMPELYLIVYVVLFVNAILHFFGLLVYDLVFADFTKVQVLEGKYIAHIHGELTEITTKAYDKFKARGALLQSAMSSFFYFLTFTFFKFSPHVRELPH